MRRHQTLSALIMDTIGEPKTGCEVGVWKGKVCGFLLRRFKELNLLMVDRYFPYYPGRLGPVGCQARTQKGIYNALFEALEATKQMADRRLLMIGDSLQCSQFVPDDSLDFVFIDADHVYESVKADIRSWTPKVHQGGLISGHDYEGRFFKVKGVKRAVDEYIREEGRELNIKNSMFWWFIK